MIRPKEMTKVSIIGPKNRLSDVIEQLHDLEVLHIEDYTGDDDELDIGDPQDAAEQISDTLVRLRSIRSKLPDVESTEQENDRNLEKQLDDLQERLDDIDTELDSIVAERQEKQQLLDKLEYLSRLGLSPDDFQEYRSVDTYLGAVNDYAFVNELPDGRYELYHDDELMALFVDTELDVDDLLRRSGFSGADVDDLRHVDGDVNELRQRLQRDLDELASRKNELEQEREALAREWRGELDRKELDLTQELEKAEAPLRFAVTENAFIAEGWVPTEDYRTVVSTLDEVTDGSIHIEELDVNEAEAPVEHDNPQGVDYFESLVKFYGIPSYKEVDPTFLLLTFPLLFGFMLGDIGYGLTSFAVFYLLYQKFPEAEGLWKSLMFCSVATIVFGLIYAEMFGFIIFGEESVLATVTGLHLFEQIPVLFHRAHELDTVLQLSVLIGIVHINFGFLVGAYNEYLRHGVKEAILAKLSWIVIEIGAAVAFLTEMTTVGGIVALAGVVMLYQGEHIEGIVEIPSLLSNILSYLRVFGVSIAVVSLALVVNVIARPLFQSGSVAMIALGVVILVVGHAMNTFIKMMEAGLQGIRLHYVEFFTKFFEGGGEYYRPFGSKAFRRS